MLKNLGIDLGIGIKEFSLFNNKAQKLAETLKDTEEITPNTKPITTSANTIKNLNFKMPDFSMESGIAQFNNLATTLESTSQKSLNFTKSIGDLAEDIGLLTLDQSSIEEFNNLSTSLSNTKNSVIKLGDNTLNLVNDLGGLKNQSQATLDSFTQGISSSYASIKELGSVMDQNAVKNYAYTQGIATTGDKLSFVQKAQASLGMTMNTGRNIVSTFQTNIANMGEEWNQLTTKFNNVKGSIGNVKNSFTELKNNYNQTKDSIINLGSSLTSSYGQIKGSLSNSINSFKEFGTNTMNNIQNVKDSFGGLKNIVDDNAVANYAYQAGIAETGAELTTLQQAQAQLGMVFSSGKNIVGSFTNTFTNLQTQWTNAKDTYSTVKSGLLEVKDSYSNLKSSLGPVKDSLLSFKGSMVSTAKKSLGFAKNLGGSALKGITSFGSSIITTATTAFPALISTLGGAITGAWSFTAALLANPITWVVAGVIALGGAIFALWKNWDNVTAWLSQKWTAFTNLISTGAEWVKGIFTNLFPEITIPNPIAKLQEWAANIKAFLGNLNFGNILKSVFESAMKLIPAPLRGLAQKIMNYLPQSPAKEGPLSNLDKVGPGLVSTVSTGLAKNKGNLEKNLNKDIAKPIDSSLHPQIDSKNRLASKKNEDKNIISSNSILTTSQNNQLNGSGDSQGGKGNILASILEILKQINQKFNKLAFSAISVPSFNKQEKTDVNTDMKLISDRTISLTKTSQESTNFTNTVTSNNNSTLTTSQNNQLNSSGDNQSGKGNILANILEVLKQIDQKVSNLVPSPARSLSGNNVSNGNQNKNVFEKGLNFVNTKIAGINNLVALGGFLISQTITLKMLMAKLPIAIGVGALSLLGVGLWSIGDNLSKNLRKSYPANTTPISQRSTEKLSKSGFFRNPGEAQQFNSWAKAHNEAKKNKNLVKSQGIEVNKDNVQEMVNNSANQNNSLTNNSTQTNNSQKEIKQVFNINVSGGNSAPQQIAVAIRNELAKYFAEESARSLNDKFNNPVYSA